MTALTPKPDAPPPQRRLGTPRRLAILAAIAAIVFAIFAMLLSRVLPEPHGRSDYMVIGTLSTLGGLITVFAGLVLGRGKRRL